MKVTPISGEICLIGSMKLSIPPNSSHEAIRVCTATRASVKIKKLSRNLRLGLEIAPVIQSYRMFCFQEKRPSFSLLVHSAHRLGLRSDGGMRAGYLHPIAISDAQTFIARPVNIERVLAEAGWNRVSLPPMALFQQFVFRWQSPKPDQTGEPDIPDASSFEPDTRLCAVSSQCTASLSPGCSRHDP